MYTQESHPWQNGTLTGLPSQYSNKIGACYPGATVPAPTKGQFAVVRIPNANATVIVTSKAPTLFKVLATLKLHAKTTVASVSDDVTATSDRNGDVVQEPIAKSKKVKGVFKQMIAGALFLLQHC